MSVLKSVQMIEFEDEAEKAQVPCAELYGLYLLSKQSSVHYFHTKELRDHFLEELRTLLQRVLSQEIPKEKLYYVGFLTLKAKHFLEIDLNPEHIRPEELDLGILTEFGLSPQLSGSVHQIIFAWLEKHIAPDRVDLSEPPPEKQEES